MDESAKTESHSSSAAAFVEGGIQDGCDDACSICLDAFCDSNPSTVTSCKHEFHLQCILEWCQRSSQCPMCWQAISMKDPISQELLEAVEQERSFRLNNARTTNIYSRPDFELQHVAVGGSDDEIEERFFQHLAAASIRRAHQNSQREGRGRSGSHGRAQYLVLSPNSYGPPESSIRASSAPRAENEPAPAIIAADPSSPITTPGGDLVGGTPLNVLLTSGTNSDPSTASNSSTRAPAERSSPVSQDRPGPSDLQSLSSLKSRLSSVSMRYRDSISKSTRGWRERLFSRSNSVADIGSEVRREINAGIASVSRMMERFDTRESRSSATSASPNSPSRSARGPGNGEVIVNHVNAGSNNSTSNDGVSVNQTNTEPSNSATSSWAVTSGPN